MFPSLVIISLLAFPPPDARLRPQKFSPSLLCIFDPLLNCSSKPPCSRDSWTHTTISTNFPTVARAHCRATPPQKSGHPTVYLTFLSLSTPHFPPCLLCRQLQHSPPLLHPPVLGQHWPQPIWTRATHFLSLRIVVSPMTTRETSVH